MASTTLGAAPTSQNDVNVQNPPSDAKPDSRVLKPDDTTTEKPVFTESPQAKSPKPSIEIDTSRPEDFEGQLATNNELPSLETLKKVEDYIVLNKHGKSRKFKSLYNGENRARRVLVIFVRHFFCGICQDYLKSLSESISPDALLRLPISTFIVVIGCGDPGLIDYYTKETGCPFPIYTDPQRSLFDALGMMKTLQMGARPAYVQRGFFNSTFSSIAQGLKYVSSGLAFKSGKASQVGGEFLFEPSNILSPISTPRRESQKILQFPEDDEKTREPIEGGQQKASVASDDEDDDGDYQVEEKRVTWCHRMKTTNDHVEIPEIMEILGLNGQGQPTKNQKRWSKALEQRKGTGSTMARQMSTMSEMSGNIRDDSA